MIGDNFFFFFLIKRKKKLFRHPVYPPNMTKQLCSPVEWQYFIYHHYIITISQYKSNSKTPTLLGLNVWRTIWDVGDGQLVVVGETRWARQSRVCLYEKNTRNWCTTVLYCSSGHQQSTKHATSFIMVSPPERSLNNYLLHYSRLKTIRKLSSSSSLVTGKYFKVTRKFNPESNNAIYV